MDKIKQIIPYLIIIIIVICIRAFIVTPVRVTGPSMNPTLSSGEILLLKKYDHNYKRFDIVVLTYGKDKLIKRVIGLPGETISYQNNKLYINGKEIEDVITTGTKDFTITEPIPEGYYFVMGDNRNNSTDSRIIGLIPKENIQGVTTFSIWPLNKFGFIE